MSGYIAQTHRMYKKEPQCKQWTLGNNDVSVYVQSVETSVALWWVILIMGEAMQV